MKTQGILLSFFFAGVFSSCTKPPVPLGSFKNIIISGNVNVILSPGPSNSLVSTSGITVATAVVGNSLILTGSGNASLAIKSIDTLTSSGNSTLSSSGNLNTNHLTIICNGSGSLTANNLNVKDSLIVFNNGAGTYTFSGTTANLRVYANGSGKLLAYGLSSTACYVAITGPGISQVYVSIITGLINGNGIVYYKGTLLPVIPVYISGTGQFIKQ